MRMDKFLKSHFFEIIIGTILLLFSFWLMFATFSYSNESMLVASKAWSDFGSQIPLIRSFSFGNNFPVQYPLFPGEPIRYHFLFYLIVGLFEKTGLRIDFALNLTSSLSFFFLIAMIFLVANKFFKNKKIAIMSVIFFIFNGSLSFVEFFKNHPLSLNTFRDIANLSTFPSFGPYDGKIVSAFWNLNIYTNQRHLALSFGLVLLTIYIFYSKVEIIKKTILTSTISFFLLFLNEAAFAINLVWIAFFSFFYFKKKLAILLPLLFSVSIFLILKNNPLNSIQLYYGFLSSQPFSFGSFLEYWVFNLGLYLLLIPLSFLIIKERKVFKFSIPLLILFFIPNLVKFSPDIINNHKFFNFFLIVSSMFVSNLLHFIWKKGILGRFLSLVLFLFLILSGIIDLMPIKNDYKISIADFSKDPRIAFFAKTNPKSITLNSTGLYHPASLAGRYIFYGYPYFAWSYGYNTVQREKTVVEIYRASSKEKACDLLEKNNISYVELSETPEKFIQPNREVWENFNKVYSYKSGFVVYDVSSSCFK